MDYSPNINVGILTGEKINFRLIGKFNILNSDCQCYNQCIASVSDGRVKVETNNNILHEAEEVTFVPCNLTADQFEIENVVIGIDFHWEQKENQKFQGALKLKALEDKIQVINILPIENYLYSVISSEMSADCSLNLLKAHTIISRSWLLAQMDKQKEIKQKNKTYTHTSENTGEYIRWYDREDHKLFHVCADDHCQRYQGVTRAHNPNVIQAVQETLAEVLMYKGTICDARFSKSCGGISELFENCWEEAEHPYLQRVVDNKEFPQGFELDLTIEENARTFINGNPEAFCNTTDEKILSQVLNDYDLSAKDFYRWKVEYSQKELAALIKEKSKRDFGDIIDLIPLQRGTSGRLVKLKVVGSKMSLTIGKELEIRRWLSKSHLYSSAFTITRETVENGIPQKFILNGAGWGHGVGLCQIGAAVMGEKGYNYKEILMHYFKGAVIEKGY